MEGFCGGSCYFFVSIVKSKAFKTFDNNISIIHKVSIIIAKAKLTMVDYS